MKRKFRPLAESIAICEKMLSESVGKDEIEYWTKRIHGYRKLQNRNWQSVVEKVKTIG